MSELFISGGAWTSPKTFTADVLTAEELNVYLRDNILNMCPQKAVNVGSMLVTSATNEISERVPTGSLVSLSESQVGGASTTFADLATIGPTVTVETGSSAIVFVYCNMYHTAPGSTFMGVAVSGASEIAASDDMAIRMSNSVGERVSAPLFMSNLSPGLNTFTAKYRINTAGTGTWSSRRMVVFPL